MGEFCLTRFQFSSFLKNDTWQKLGFYKLVQKKETTGLPHLLSFFPGKTVAKGKIRYHMFQMGKCYQLASAHKYLLFTFCQLQQHSWVMKVYTIEGQITTLSLWFSVFRLLQKLSLHIFVLFYLPSATIWPWLNHTHRYISRTEILEKSLLI